MSDAYFTKYNSSFFLRPMLVHLLCWNWGVYRCRNWVPCRATGGEEDGHDQVQECNLQLPPFEFVKLAVPSFLCPRSCVACDICDLHRKKRLCHQRRDQQRRLSSLQQLKWQRALLRAAILLDWTRYIFSFPWEFNESIEPKHKHSLKCIVCTEHKSLSRLFNPRKVLNCCSCTCCDSFMRTPDDSISWLLNLITTLSWANWVLHWCGNCKAFGLWVVGLLDLN